MADRDFALSRDRRDMILRALDAIQRQVGSLHTTPLQGSFDSRGLVIGTNVTIIQSCLTNLPWTNSPDSGS